MSKYSVQPTMMQQILDGFTYHPPKDDQQERYVMLRDAAKELGYL